MSDGPGQPRVPFTEKLALGVGGLSAFFGAAGISILAYPVYNMLLGVSATTVGLALMIPRIWDAFSDPIMGRISDNFASRWGRRRPFVILGAIAMGLSFVAIWHVPQHWSESWKVGYFIASQLVFFTAFTVFSVPFAALSYEMTPDYKERNSVMAYLAFFHKCGEFLAGWMIPLAVVLSVYLVSQQMPDAAEESGDSAELNAQGIRGMAWIIGTVVLVGLGMLPGLFVKERYAEQAKTQKKVGILSSMRGAATSMPFVILVAVIVLNTMAGVLASSIDQYLLVYFMYDGSTSDGLVQKAILSSGYAVVGFLSIPVMTYIANRLGKKRALFVVYGLTVVGGIAKWFIFTPGRDTLTIGPTQFDPVLMIDPMLCGPMWVAVKILLASMMADICDEDELKHGLRREGMFAAVFSWLEKCVVSAAFFGTGLALGLSGFDVALGAEQSEATFTKMRLFLAGAPALTALLAIAALAFYPITADSAAETRRQLDLRHQQKPETPSP
ncbi:MAG: MFS transporter [Planctomycetota bacterium]